MRVGIGLPGGIPGADGHTVIDWARRADEGPFTSLAVIDRYVYDSYEALTSLAAAAAVTHRVRLATTIVVGPLRNTATLAKTAATVDALSGGRLVLGLAVGAREDDYQVAKIDYRQRGRIFTDQLASLRTLWDSGAIGPKPVRAGGPEILVGGLSDQAYLRAARYADGYVHGGGPPRAFGRAADRARAAWRDAGRPGLPQLWGQGYFALGDGAADRGAQYLKEYYAFTGPFAERIAAGLLATTQSVIQYIRGYEEAGCGELVLLPTIAEPSQLDRLAEVCASL
ncbi:MAG TPA: LLM class flavin-dependent oxidoreductase [Candidatus Binataceae bacterium]|nr:LLM class flavin-dependent oxidoreductase [Candidatus Binataceae bacterium]